MPLIRTQKMIADEEALRTRVPSSRQHATPAPAPTPRRDLIAEAAGSVDQFVEVQDAHSATLLEGSPEAALRAVQERAVESVLRDLVAANPSLSASDVVALRTRLQERGER